MSSFGDSGFAMLKYPSLFELAILLGLALSSEKHGMGDWTCSLRNLVVEFLSLPDSEFTL